MSSPRSFLPISALIIVAGAGVLLLVWLTTGSPAPSAPMNPPSPTPVALEIAPPATATATPKPVSAPSSAANAQTTPLPETAALLPTEGKPAAVSQPPLESAPPVLTGQTADALADAHRTGENAEATSPLLAVAPFDAETFAKDPEPYLQQSIPGRVFQTAHPGPGVPVLGARGPATHEVPHGGSCELAVRAPAGAAVTFTTFDLGLFDNGLASISVLANADGVAIARFRAVGEVAGDIHLLAGSPFASGQVKFLVGVLPPPTRVSQTN